MVGRVGVRPVTQQSKRGGLVSALLAVILASVPNVLLAIASKLVTEKFMQSVLEKVLVYGLKQAAQLSTNTVDDELVLDIEKRLKEQGA